MHHDHAGGTGSNFAYAELLHLGCERTHRVLAQHLQRHPLAKIALGPAVGQRWAYAVIAAAILAGFVTLSRGRAAVPDPIYAPRA